MAAEDRVWYPDYYRTTDDKTFQLRHFLRDYLFQHRLRYVVLFRVAQNTKSRFVKLICEIMLFRLCRKYGIEIKTQTKIGSGFCMTHPYNITISPFAVLGNNVTMMKGSTIGIGKSINGRSAPIIGNHVYVGLNSTVIGEVAIGDDVLIAPNTLLNCDVPSHSVVIGCPYQIHHKENTTRDVIWKYI